MAQSNSKGPDKETMRNWYRQMVLIRRFEEKCAELYSAGDIGGFLHLYIGQEAIVVAAQSVLREDDNIITAYRDHGVALARGLSTKGVMAEMLGKATGVSKGKGGSMHLADKEKRFWGGWAIVGGHLPLAAGIALADQYNGDDRVTMALMGDGATNIGYFHESLNLSAVWDLPVVWLVENNGYGMGTAVDRASGQPEIVKKAHAYGMKEGPRIDGMNVIEVHEQVAEAIDYASKHGPILMESLTYRFQGHSMGDPERYRTKEEVQRYAEGDPIGRLRGHILEKYKSVKADDLNAIEDTVMKTVEDAVEFAENSPNPTFEDLISHVYVD